MVAPRLLDSCLIIFATAGWRAKDSGLRVRLATMLPLVVSGSHHALFAPTVERKTWDEIVLSLATPCRGSHMHRVVSARFLATTLENGGIVQSR